MKHHYPTTPLKKTRDDPSKKKRKKKKLKRKKVEKKEVEVEAIALSSEQTMESMFSLEGAETPESVIITIPTFVTREGEKLLEDKLNTLKKQRRKKDREFKEKYEKSLAKVKADTLVSKDENNEHNNFNAEGDQFESVDDFAGALAEKIIDDTLSSTSIEPEMNLTSSYAQNLASAILSQAMDNMVDIMTEKEKLFEKVNDINTVKGEPTPQTLKTSAKDYDQKSIGNTKTIQTEADSEELQDYYKSLRKSGRKTTSPTRYFENQVDFESRCISTRLVI